MIHIVFTRIDREHETVSFDHVAVLSLFPGDFGRSVVGGSEQRSNQATCERPADGSADRSNCRRSQSSGRQEGANWCTQDHSPCRREQDSADPDGPTSQGTTDGTLARFGCGVFEVIDVDRHLHVLVFGIRLLPPYDAERVGIDTECDQLVDRRLGLVSIWEYTYNCRHHLLPVLESTRPRRLCNPFASTFDVLGIGCGRGRTGCCDWSDMTSFDARLRLLGEKGFPLGVEIDLSGERMTVTADGKAIADWSLDEIRITPTPSGFRIDAEGEAIIINVTEDDLFRSEIGPRLVEL